MCVCGIPLAFAYKYRKIWLLFRYSLVCCKILNIVGCCRSTLYIKLYAMEAHFLYLLLVLIVVINLCVFMSSQASSQLWLLTRNLWNQRWMRRKLQSSSSSRRFFAWVWLWATCRWRRSRSSKTSRWASTSWFHCLRRIGRTWVLHAFSFPLFCFEFYFEFPHQVNMWHDNRLKLINPKLT